LQQKAPRSGKFAFPPQIDTKMTSRKCNCNGSDKVASSAEPGPVGTGIFPPWWRNFVKSFLFSGPSYKVIPQLKRIERLMESVAWNLCERPERPTLPLSTFATLQKKPARAAQSLPASTP